MAVVGEWTDKHQQILNSWAARVLDNIYKDPERRIKFEKRMEEAKHVGLVSGSRYSQHGSC